MGVMTGALTLAAASVSGDPGAVVRTTHLRRCRALGRVQAPTAFVLDLDGAELGAPALRDLARNARAAAEWCEENG